MQAIHDYGHRGVNNDFLVRTGDKLAVCYNDRSPQENHHLAASFSLLSKEELNWMKGISNKQKVRGAGPCKGSAEPFRRRELVSSLVGGINKKHAFRLDLNRSRPTWLFESHPLWPLDGCTSLEDDLGNFSVLHLSMVDL